MPCISLGDLAGEWGVRVAGIVGGVDFESQQKLIRTLQPSLVVATPGRLLSLCGETPASTRARQLSNTAPGQTASRCPERAQEVIATK